MKKTLKDCARGLRLVTSDFDVTTSPEELCARLEALFEEEEKELYHEEKLPKSGHPTEMILMQQRDFEEMCDEVETEYGVSLKKAFREEWL